MGWTATSSLVSVTAFPHKYQPAILAGTDLTTGVVVLERAAAVVCRREGAGALPVRTAVFRRWEELN